MNDRPLDAVIDLIRRVNTAETALERIQAAWHDLPHTDRKNIADWTPQLADALVRAERP